MPDHFYYEGFTSPNGTVVPDDVFDLIAPQLTEAELRVLLYIIRRTFGFKKDSDTISLKQMVDGITTREGRILDRGAGVVKSAATRAVKGLVEKGIITATRNRSLEKGDEPTTYTLRFRHDPVFSKRTGGVLPKEHGGIPGREQGGVHQEDTQQTVLQQTDEVPSNSSTPTQPNPQEPDPSKFRKVSRPGLDDGRRNKPPMDPSPGGSAQGMTQIRAVLQAKGLTRQRSADSPPSTPKPVEQSGPTRLPTGKPTARAAPPAAVGADEREAIARYLGDFAPELGDTAKFRSSLTWACNTYAASGLTLGAFTSRLYTARSRTKERRPSIKGRPFPYFKALVEEECGLREPPLEIAAAAKAHAEDKPTVGKTDPPPKSLAGRYQHLVRH